MVPRELALPPTAGSPPFSTSRNLFVSLTELQLSDPYPHAVAPGSPSGRPHFQLSTPSMRCSSWIPQSRGSAASCMHWSTHLKHCCKKWLPCIHPWPCVQLRRPPPLWRATAVSPMLTPHPNCKLPALARKHSVVPASSWSSDQGAPLSAYHVACLGMSTATVGCVARAVGGTFGCSIISRAWRKVHQNLRIASSGRGSFAK